MVRAIVGANWGDEGKGKITDMFAGEADIVVRFQGGANAGHTIINEHGRFAFHLMPSGVCYDNVTCIIGNGVALDIDKFVKELADVKAAGLNPHLLVSDRAQVLMPYHILLDTYEEERLGKNAFGSTKSGIAPFFSDKFSKIGIQVNDLFDDEALKAKLQNVCTLKNLVIEHVYHKPLLDPDELYRTCVSYREKIAPFVCDTHTYISAALKEGKNILLEGQLGTLKDPDFGIYPMVTSSSTLAGYGAVGAGIPPHEIKEIVAVTKAYSSAVGAGEFVSEILDEDKAQRDEVVASVSKGVEFRGVNLWVLIFATMIASLGLNVNSAAVIIGAMLISPIMGPIMGVGLALGINDFELLKKSLRNLALMFIVAIITSTVYFFISPLSSNSSELLARTVPTTYDVLIALFGGLAGIVAQTRQDRTSTVIPGVAIATALIPPLCTAGFGLATGQFKFFIGAFYLFFINSVFIALATYAMVRFLQYEKKVFIDKVRERTVKRLMMVITLVTFIPSVVIGFHMVRVSLFEAVADKYVSQVFNFPHTRVIECNKHYAQGKNPSQIELLLVGEPLGEEVIENARTQMRNFGLEEAELVVRQANTEDKVDVVSLQKSYQELLEEKNRRIGEMSSQLKRYRVTNVEVNDISREVGAMMDNIGAISLTKGITFDVDGTPGDTTLVCVVTPRDSALPVDRETLIRWLRIRTKVENVKLFVEP